MSERFSRSERILGSAAMERLKASHVAVFGIGGVGGYTVEALARSGVGALTIIDNDTVSVTNINRQIYALGSTVGMYKTDVAAARIKDISPECRVTALRLFFLPETKDTVDFSRFDYVVDAIDTVSGKLAVIECANAAGVPVISSMGTGNKLDPTKLEAADIYETSVCPLARVMRTECRKRGIGHLRVVYSKELPLTPQDEIGDDTGGTRRAVPGSVAFVPPAAGLIIAGEVVRYLIGEKRSGS